MFSCWIWRPNLLRGWSPFIHVHLCLRCRQSQDINYSQVEKLSWEKVKSDHSVELHVGLWIFFVPWSKNGRSCQRTVNTQQNEGLETQHLLFSIWINCLHFALICGESICWEFTLMFAQCLFLSLPLQPVSSCAFFIVNKVSEWGSFSRFNIIV